MENYAFQPPASQTQYISTAYQQASFLFTLCFSFILGSTVLLGLALYIHSDLVLQAMKEMQLDMAESPVVRFATGLYFRGRKRHFAL